MLIMNRHPFSQIRREMNELLGGMLANGLPAAVAPASAPPMNVWEQGDRFFIEAELPGYKLEDIEVTVLGNEATIKGTRSLESPEGATALRRERQGGTFSRTWTLPMDIDADHVEASLNNGVLLVALPKTAEAKPRRITVRSA